MALLKGSSVGINYGPSYGESPWPEFEAIQSDLSAAQSHFKAQQYGLALNVLNDAGAALSILKQAIQELSVKEPVDGN